MSNSDQVSNSGDAYADSEPIHVLVANLSKKCSWIAFQRLVSEAEKVDEKKKIEGNLKTAIKGQILFKRELQCGVLTYNKLSDAEHTISKLKNVETEDTTGANGGPNRQVLKWRVFAKIIGESEKSCIELNQMPDVQELVEFQEEFGDAVNRVVVDKSANSSSANGHANGDSSKRDSGKRKKLFSEDENSENDDDADDDALAKLVAENDNAIAENDEELSASKQEKADQEQEDKQIAMPKDKYGSKKLTAIVIRELPTKDCCGHDVQGNPKLAKHWILSSLPDGVKSGDVKMVETKQFRTPHKATYILIEMGSNESAQTMSSHLRTLQRHGGDRAGERWNVRMNLISDKEFQKIKRIRDGRIPDDFVRNDNKYDKKMSGAKFNKGNGRGGNNDNRSGNNRPVRRDDNKRDNRDNRRNDRNDRGRDNRRDNNRNDNRRDNNRNTDRSRDNRRDDKRDNRRDDRSRRDDRGRGGNDRRDKSRDRRDRSRDRRGRR